MNSEVRRMNNRRNEIKNEINRLVNELNSVENEMKTKMVENLTVDQLLSILTNEETVIETETEEVTVETEETAFTMENIRQAEDNEIEQTIRTNISETVEPETEEIEVIDNSTSNCPHIESDQVTFDMLSDDMHNAMITLVGIKYQDLYRDGEVPTIGETVTLTKETDTHNTYGRIADGRTIGILPQGDEKIAQLERIGANYIKNREVLTDSPLLQQEYKIVDFIPGCFIFLNPIQEEIENETTIEVSQPTEEKLEGIASSTSDARNIFTSHKRNCTIDEIIEDENFFIIKYLNHPAQSMEEYNKECCIEKA